MHAMRVHTAHGQTGVYWSNEDNEQCSLIINGLTMASCTEVTLRDIYQCLAELFTFLGNPPQQTETPWTTTPYST